jgi:glycosyltransferase involved in cell wall biosynthesis
LSGSKIVSAKSIITYTKVSKSLVSVIIPCHNASATVAQAVESVLDQKGVPFEVIVVDDGSTDGSLERLRLFGSRIRLESVTHRGAAAARNHGTSLAKGSWLQYLDADDRLLPGALERRVSFLKDGAADLVYSDWQKFHEKKAGFFEPGVVVRKVMEEVDADPVRAILTDFWVPPAAWMCRRGLAEKIGGWDETMENCEDVRFLLEAALCGARFLRIPVLGAEYRVTLEPSLSRRNRRLFYLNVMRLASEAESRWAVRGPLDRASVEALVKVYGGVARAGLETDLSIFKQARSHLERLRPGYLPAFPRRLRWLSLCVGYEQAEKLALRYRRMKRWAVI